MDGAPDRPSTLIICSGAVANEIVTIVRENGWRHMKVECLLAKLHNEPDALPGRRSIKAGRAAIPIRLDGRPIPLHVRPKQLTYV